MMNNITVYETLTAERRPHVINRFPERHTFLWMFHDCGVWESIRNIWGYWKPSLEYDEYDFYIRPPAQVPTSPRENSPRDSRRSPRHDPEEGFVPIRN